MKVNWFQLKMPFNWYQLKLVLRSRRILTGLLLEVYYHQLKSTGTCYNQLVPVESQLVPVESQLVPVENSNWSNRNFLLGFHFFEALDGAFDVWFFFQMSWLIRELQKKFKSNFLPGLHILLTFKEIARVLRELKIVTIFGFDAICYL